MTVDGIPEHVWKAWEKKRRRTFIGFLFLTFIMGLDMSAVFTTMFIYLKDLVRANNPSFYYSLCLGGFNLTSLICCFTFGRWLDTTRKVRLYSRLALLVQMIGYVFYTIHFHPVFIVVGRLFNGVSDSFASVVSGELFRIYDENDGVKANFWLSAAGFVGVLFGPSLSAAFRNVEFNIGSLTINYLNMPGVILIFLMMISLVVVTLLVHDCSAELDLKEYLRKQHHDDTMTCNYDVESDVGENDVKQKNTSAAPTTTTAKEEDMCYLNYVKPENIPIKKVLECFSKHNDTLVIFITTFVIMYTVYSACVVIPMVIEGELHWDISKICIIIVAYGALGLVLIILLGKFLSSNRTIYYLGVFSITCQIGACIILSYLKTMKSDMYMDVILLSVEICFLIIGWFFADTMLRVIFSKMVPSTIQSFSECLRAGMTRSAIILASFLAPNLFPWLRESALVSASGTLLVLIAFLVRKPTLLEPKEIDFDGGYTVLSNSFK